MPKSDTWPGGTGSETVTGMDSAGSCDSVVSVNSGFSDDSLEYLSAEEKACLMFLEETIESLDTDDDSGLSNDEPDLPALDNLGTKMAQLSASIGTNKLNGSPKRACKELSTDLDKDHKPIPSYLLPTPFLLANSSHCSPTAKPGKNEENVHPKPQLISPHSKPGPEQSQHGIPHITPEVKVVEIPPPTKPKGYPSRTSEGSSPRGPLSYDALVHLRRTASVKKSPLQPTHDDTIDLVKQSPTSTAPSTQRNIPGVPSHTSLQEDHKPKTSPPAVAPKPTGVPCSVPVKTQIETGTQTQESFFSDRCMSDPVKIRLEALQKLGLLKDKEAEHRTATSLSPPQSYSPWDISANRFVRDPVLAALSRSPSLCCSQEPTGPKARPVQSSASFHHHTRNEPTFASHPPQPTQHSGVKTVCLEGGHMNHEPYQASPHPLSTSLGSHRGDEHKEHSLAPGHTKVPETLKPTASTQPAAHRPLNPQGYSVEMVPGMGKDRKEALKKLGLLKES